MKITQKIALLQIFLIICFIGMAGFVGLQIWGGNYRLLEHEQVIDNMERVKHAWGIALDRLDSQVGDWGPWDDLYAFAQDPGDSDFVEKNLSDAAIANLKLNAVMISNNTGKTLFATTFDLEAKSRGPASKALEDALTHLTLNHALDFPGIQSQTGLVLIEGKPILFAMHKILKSDSEGPSPGILFFARNADDRFLQEISDTTRVEVGFTANAEWQGHFTNSIYQDIGKETVKAYIPLTDIDGNSNYALISSTPRKIVQQGQTQTHSFLIIVILLGMVLAGITWILLNEMVFRRIRVLQVFIDSISNQQEYSSRLSLEGNDEISRTADAMNNLLDQIEKSQEENCQLYQSAQVELQERKKVETTLRYLVSHDSLTGLYNRAHFDTELNRLTIGQAKNIGIICCDVDGLKLVNDTLGHQAGDRLLVRVANSLRNVFPEEAVIARIGGDEFVIILADVGEQSVQELCHQLRGRVETEAQLGNELSYSLSIGWGFHNGAVLTLESLQAVYIIADDAMYRQKLSNSQSSENRLVQGMLELLKVRDYITEGHSQRLQQHVEALGRLAGLNDNQVIDLGLLAQFHDIGKVGIPDSILLKPDKLTPTERQEMERHSEIGCRIAQTIPELLPISDFILKHHEWWNGSGYPLKLKGEEIPIEDRILTIVDSFDAMTNDRPYRKALTIEESLEEIEKSAGSQFDPSLARLFIDFIKMGPEKSM